MVHPVVAKEGRWRGYSLGRVLPIHNPTWYNAVNSDSNPLLLIPLACLAIRYGTPGAGRSLERLEDPRGRVFAAERLLECIPSAMGVRIAARQLIQAQVVLGTNQ
jgi:hypothetical protein